MSDEFEEEITDEDKEVLKRRFGVGEKELEELKGLVEKYDGLLPQSRCKKAE